MSRHYLIHIDAIKKKLEIIKLTKEQMKFTYAEEADVLNVALFGMTAKEWRTRNKDLKGNIRDYALSIELTIFSNNVNILMNLVVCWRG